MILTELEMRVLATLEEAGEENAAALLNTVTRPTGDPTQLHEFQASLKSLVGRGLIRLSTEIDERRRLKDLTADQSIDAIERLSAQLIFDSSIALWCNLQHHGPPFPDPYPYIVTTPLGNDSGSTIVRERGDRWWSTRGE